METLPTTAQTNILSFLIEEHHMFHAKDLEFLALQILSAAQLDFWVQHAAETLLLTIRGSGDKLIEGKIVSLFLVVYIKFVKNNWLITGHVLLCLLHSVVEIKVGKY